MPNRSRSIEQSWISNPVLNNSFGERGGREILAGYSGTLPRGIKLDPG